MIVWRSIQQATVSMNGTMAKMPGEGGNDHPREDDGGAGPDEEGEAGSREGGVSDQHSSERDHDGNHIAKRVLPGHTFSPAGCCTCKVYYNSFIGRQGLNQQRERS